VVDVAPHHQALAVGYTVALAGWLAAGRVFRQLWPDRPAPCFRHPWREVGWAILAVAVTVALGQCYLHGYRLAVRGPFAPAVDALDQVLIFSPLLLLPVLRRQGPQTAWLPTTRVWQRLLVGTGLALLAILAFTLWRTGSDHWLTVVSRVYHPRNISLAVQVFCEDVAIAILFVRFQAALGVRLSVLLVAVLFAGAHLPTLLAEGASIEELLGLLLDAALGVLLLTVVRRSQDVWWFWCVHFAMDMMQFYALPPTAPLPIVEGGS
jgi:hypothetical protein